MTVRYISLMLVAGLGLAGPGVGPVAADDAKAEAQHGVRVQMRAGPPGQQPQIRMWVDGEEVDPGEAVDLGEGKAQIRIRAAPQARAPREADQKEEQRDRGRGALGVMVAPLTDELARRADVDTGVAVTGVVEGSPAQRAGFREGDVITHVAGRSVRSPEDLAGRIGDRRAGDRVRVRWRRRRKQMEATIRLADRDELASEVPDRPPRDRRDEPPETPRRAHPEEDKEEAPDERRAGFLGIMAVPLNDDMREIAGTDEGVLINSLTDDSPAAKAGLKPGDVIVRIDDTPVHTVEELVETLRRRKPGDRVHIVYYRMRKRRETQATLGSRPGEEAEAETKEGLPLFDLPEDLFGDQAPRLREYLERLRPEMEEWARRFREQHRERGEPWPRPGRPEGPPADTREPYDVGKDIGRVLQRLDRIERRLDAIEERLRDMDR